jgi:hypothetical protein
MFMVFSARQYVEAGLATIPSSYGIINYDLSTIPTTKDEDDFFYFADVLPMAQWASKDGDIFADEKRGAPRGPWDFPDLRIIYFIMQRDDPSPETIYSTYIPNELRPNQFLVPYCLTEDKKVHPEYISIWTSFAQSRSKLFPRGTPMFRRLTGEAQFLVELPTLNVPIKAIWTLMLTFWSSAKGGKFQAPRALMKFYELLKKHEDVVLPQQYALPPPQSDDKDEDKGAAPSVIDPMAPAIPAVSQPVGALVVSTPLAPPFGFLPPQAPLDVVPRVLTPEFVKDAVAELGDTSDSKLSKSQKKRLKKKEIKERKARLSPKSTDAEAVAPTPKPVETLVEVKATVTPPPPVRAKNVAAPVKGAIPIPRPADESLLGLAPAAPAPPVKAVKAAIGLVGSKGAGGPAKAALAPAKVVVTAVKLPTPKKVATPSAKVATKPAPTPKPVKAPKKAVVQPATPPPPPGASPATDDSSDEDSADEDAVVCHFCLTDAQKQFVEKVLYPGRTVQLVHPTPHTHPLLAIERAAVEEDIIGMLPLKTTEVIDVGGNPIRHFNKGRTNVWSACPILDSADVIRENRRKLHRHPTKLRYCNHMCPQQCTELLEGRFSTAMGVHVLYYLTPQQVLEICLLVSSRTFISAHHLFPSVKGTFSAGEATYEMRSGDTVEMTVHHEAKTYVHSNLRWLNEMGYVGTVGGVTYQLCWDSVMMRGSTAIYMFTVTDKIVPMVSSNKFRILSLIEAQNQAKLVGPVEFRSFLGKDTLVATVFEDFLTSEASMYSYEDTFILGFSKDKILRLPKDVVGAIALYVAAKDRSPVLFQQAVQQAKTLLGRQGLTPTEQAEVAVYCTALGFVINLHQETKTVSSMVIDNHYGFGKLRGLLNFNVPWHPGTILRWCYENKSTILIATLAGYIIWSNSNAHKRLHASASQAVVRRVPHANLHKVVFRFGKFLHATLIDNATELVRNIWHWVIGVGKKSFELYEPISYDSFTARVVNHGPIRYISHCNFGRTIVLPLAKGARYSIDLKRFNCTPTFGCMQIGPAVTIRKPVVARSCTHNDELMIANRGLRRKPVDDMTALEFADCCALWNAKYNWVMNSKRLLPLEKQQHRKIGYISKVRPVDRVEWIKRFPSARQGVLLQATQTLEAYIIKDKHPTAPFMKQELLIKCFSSFGVMSFDPRLIQGSTPSFQVLCGPTFAAVNARLKKALTYRIGEFSSTLIWTSGFNANKLGAVFDDIIKNIPPEELLLSESDGIRTDSQIGLPQMDFSQKLFCHFIRESLTIHLMHSQEHFRGFTPNGVYYEGEYTIKSGYAWTSSGTSMMVGFSKDYFNQHCSVVERSVVANGRRHAFELIAGDDEAGFIRVRAENRLKYGEELAKHNKLSGFNMEIALFTNKFDLTFCSGRFWPSTKGTIFGPKIGRVIVKSYHSRANLETQTDILIRLRQVALGLRDDVSHIPVLRVINARILALTPAVSVKALKQEEHKYHVVDPGEVCPESFDMMHHLYGLTAVDVLALERWLEENITSVICTIQHPVLDHIVEVDCQLVESNWRPSSVFMASLGSLVDVLLDIEVSEAHEWLVFVGSPLFEELLKQRSNLAVLAIPTLELIGYVAVAPVDERWLTAVAYLAGPLPLHLLTTFVSRTFGLKPALALHYFYNVGVMRCHEVSGHVSAFPSVADRVPVFVKEAGMIFTLSITVTVLSIVDGFGEVLAKGWSKLMHALNGNMEANDNSLVTGGLRALTVFGHTYMVCECFGDTCVPSGCATEKSWDDFIEHPQQPGSVHLVHGYGQGTCFQTTRKWKYYSGVPYRAELRFNFRASVLQVPNQTIHLLNCRFHHCGFAFVGALSRDFRVFCLSVASKAPPISEEDWQASLDLMALSLVTPAPAGLHVRKRLRDPSSDDLADW